MTGNIPLANQIKENILIKYRDDPDINQLKDKDITYSETMGILSPDQRNKLLKNYIDKAKINVSHIYLAQLLKEGYVDYILTVNFDNLMLRALALYNIFPPTYDMAILKDLTTTNFQEGSVVYLHGQHHSPWLLNTEEEMNIVNPTVPKVFDSIKHRRAWVFIGYSGSDPIFEHLKSLGRFDNRLYWISYFDNEPASNVSTFLDTPNRNAFNIKGYNADAFMLAMNKNLDLVQPEILDKPFSSLLDMLNGINDIDDDEHFRGVKQRLEISQNNVEKAIRQFEKNEIVSIVESTLQVDKFKKDIINVIISNKYNETKVKELEEKASEFNNSKVSTLLSNLFFNWGVNLGDLAQFKGR